MKKTFRQAALALGLGLGACVPSAFAATATGTFSVNVTLTPKCEITGAINALSLNYDSFQTSASTGNTSFSMRCTGGQTFSVALDGTTPGTYTDSTTNLGYTLKLSTNASSPSGGDTASLSGTGTGSTAQTFYVHANVAGNQTGQGGGSGTTSVIGTTQRTLTITY